MPEKEMGWKLGDDENIQVWQHNWIFSESYFKPFVNRESSFPNLWANQLIDQEERTWDLATIEAYVHPINRDRILNISIPLTTSNDGITWIPRKNGNFSVKLAYYFYFKCLNHSNFSRSTSDIPLKFWKFLWTKTIPPRLRIWIKRMIRNKLPTKTNLILRRIQLLDSCKFCNNTEESIRHILFNYTIISSILRQFWPNSHIIPKSANIQQTLISFWSPSSTMDFILCRLFGWLV